MGCPHTHIIPGIPGNDAEEAAVKKEEEKPTCDLPSSQVQCTDSFPFSHVLQKGPVSCIIGVPPPVFCFGTILHLRRNITAKKIISCSSMIPAPPSLGRLRCQTLQANSIRCTKTRVHGNSYAKQAKCASTQSSSTHTLKPTNVSVEGKIGLL